jgi:hypothetical protein
MRANSLRSAALLLAATVAFPGGALLANGIYKSVDAQGHVVYSDQPDLSAAQTSVVETPESSPAGEVEVRVTEPPPPLPDEQQPQLPDDGDLWTPGYWAWSAAGYYWVPGAWVPPPGVGLLWTPGYWVYADAVYVFRRGYWASRVGYYGGIAYGFGYFGQGFVGGRWVGNSFVYNREAAAGRGVRARVSYNNGPGGTTTAPTAQELAFAAQPHLAPTALQRHSLAQAARMPTLMTPQPSYRVTQNAPRDTAVPGPPATLVPRPPVRAAAPPPAVIPRAAAPPPTAAQQPAVTRPKPPVIRHVMPTLVNTH